MSERLPASRILIGPTLPVGERHVITDLIQRAITL